MREISDDYITWIGGVDVELTIPLIGRTRIVVRVRIGEQNVNVQFEAAVWYVRLQWCREWTRMKSNQHFRATIESNYCIRLTKIVSV